MPLRSMAGTSLQLTCIEVELLAVVITLYGGSEGTEEKLTLYDPFFKVECNYNYNTSPSSNVLIKISALKGPAPALV